MSLFASMIDCAYPFIFPDVEIDVMTENGVKIIAIDNMSDSHIWILAVLFALTPILWIWALWQLFCISRVWQKGEFLTREIGVYFKRFSHVILMIFLVESFLGVSVEYLLLEWQYIDALPEITLGDISFFVELPFLVASIFLLMGSKAMSEVIVIKEESDLTI
ncbi:hypothetical protein [Curvivirga aplysinae]|uniref:hypothetical protein n=1 Tax=Curvivirga aplysinae TaxID=2529852 RepID=UPI0012BCF5A5|nr:hypothetical protein [Curvivirga aplysinae]MTI09167.1 hypothetical protein [Curvivirga aplysinae]